MAESRDRLLRSSFCDQWSTAVLLIRAGLLGIWLQLNVRGFRPVLARGWHVTPGPDSASVQRQVAVDTSHHPTGYASQRYRVAMTDERAVSEAALEAVGNLLKAAHTYGIGVSFEPDSVGWSVGYIEGMGGGNLASAYDLETAAKAAERPLDELASEVKKRRGQVE